MTEYFVPTGASETELVEKRSRFLGRVWPVESEEEARARIEEIRKKHYDARHHCWCYRIREGGVERYSDDGEPQGTAGLHPVRQGRPGRGGHLRGAPLGGGGRALPLLLL